MSDPQGIVQDEFFDSLLGDFLDESGQLLDRLNANLLQLDEWVRSIGDDGGGRCSEELLNEMFRAAHSLKGLSAMLGLSDINLLTHKVENIFDAARKDELPVNTDVVELVFHAVDRLGGLVEALKNPATPKIEYASIIESISQMLQSAGVERAQTTQADAEKALAFESTDGPTAESVAPPIDASAARSIAGSALAEADAMIARDGPPSSEATRTLSDASETLASARAPAEDSSWRSAPPSPSRETDEQLVPRADEAAADAPAVDHFEGLDDESEISPKYLAIFIDETELSLDQLTETLLALEGHGSVETVERLLVTAHRIKGSAASIGLNRPAKLAHLMEDLLQDLAEARRPLTALMVDSMLMCTDGLRQYLQGLKSGQPQSRNFNRLAHDLLLAQASPAPAVAAPSSAVAAAAARDAAALAGSLAAVASIVAGRSPEPEMTLVGRVTFQNGLALVGLKARLVYEKLASLGEICYFDPPAESLDDLEAIAEVCFGVVSDKSADAVRRKLRVAGVEELEVAPLAEAAHPAKPVAGAAATPSADPSVAACPASVPADATATVARGAASRQPSAAAEAEPARGPATAESAAKAKTAEAANRPAETLRVDIDRLDQLMNLAGQLVINKARFARIGDKLKGALNVRHTSTTLTSTLDTLTRITQGKEAEEKDLRGELHNLRGIARRLQHDLEAIRRDMDLLGQMRTSVNDLFEAIHQLDRVSDGIQQSVMDTRMLPIGPLFTRFRRVVRDITRANGKNINLVINGEKTELDKRMIDELGDPLIHMVRNAADHGIESPEIREAAGKPRQGTITLDAFHRGNSIYIQVTDDGKGLDAERIRRKAVERGLISEADAEKLTRQQVFQLIWEPGLSTAEKVTEVSGRGMGMDIVKSKIEDLNGVVDLDSEAGKGTRLTIKLPLTLAILPSLMVEIDRDVFAMPLEAVVEIVRLGRGDIATVQNERVARVRGRVISMVRLAELFAWNAHDARPRPEEAAETTLVIIGEAGKEIGIAVDNVIGEEDVVIKSMAENYRNVPGVAGASILGDGRVSLILDLAAMIDMASRKGAALA